MEDINSCLMLAVGLYTPVSLSCIFEPEDLKDTGVEFDSHITLMYAQGKTIPHEHLLSDVITILDEDWEGFRNSMMNVNPKKVLDFFELSSFENDSDYIILKLKKNTDLYDKLRSVNKGLKSKYNVTSEYNEYVPHMTLAELQPGTAGKYLNSPNLKLVLKDTMVDLEDLVISYGKSNEVNDRKQYFLTHYKNVDRYFRLNELREFSRILNSEE